MRFEIMDCVHHDIDFICDSLAAYNMQQVPATQPVNFIRINKKIVDEKGRILAGGLAKIYYWRIACMDILWVDEEYRRMGLGSKLLSEIEAAVHEKCSLIHLDTFDFQAKDFYIRHGYELFGTLENCPENHCRYYLKKDLKAHAAVS